MRKLAAAPAINSGADNKKKKKKSQQRIEREGGGESSGRLACSTTPGRRLGMGEGRRSALTISVLLKLAAEPRQRKQRRTGTNGSLSPYLSLALATLPGKQVGRVDGRRVGLVKKREGRKKKRTREKETKTQQVCTA